jgi:hypothetical protein
VRDADGQQFAYVYYETEPGPPISGQAAQRRRSAPDREPECYFLDFCFAWQASTQRSMQFDGALPGWQRLVRHQLEQSTAACAKVGKRPSTKLIT